MICCTTESIILMKDVILSEAQHIAIFYTVPVIWCHFFFHKYIYEC
jgi:hypothetical protein